MLVAGNTPGLHRQFYAASLVPATTAEWQADPMPWWWWSRIAHRYDGTVRKQRESIPSSQSPVNVTLCYVHRFSV